MGDTLRDAFFLISSGHLYQSSGVVARKTLKCPVTENTCVKGACSVRHCADQSAIAAKEGASEFVANRKRESRIINEWLADMDSKHADAAIEILSHEMNKNSN